MTFLSSVFSCCASQSVSEKAGQETRHARIVSAVRQHDHHASLTRSRSQPQSPRYYDNPPEYGDIAHHPLITIDEKNPADFDVFEDEENVEQEQPDEDTGSSPPPISPYSSVVSIPSTLLTDLTSLPTGDSFSVGGRPSLDRYPSRSTRPPSYYNIAGRTPSPAFSAAGDGDRRRDEVWLHPVMQSNWLEVLQEHAVGRATAPLSTSRPIERNTANR